MNSDRDIGIGIGINTGVGSFVSGTDTDLSDFPFQVFVTSSRGILFGSWSAPAEAAATAMQPTTNRVG